jgi:hypothetical protein
LNNCKKDTTDFARDHELNNSRIKQNFPTNNDQQREQNDVARRLLDQDALELLRFQTK